MSHLASRKVESIYIGWASLHECELELGHANGTRATDVHRSGAHIDERQDDRDTGHETGREGNCDVGETLYSVIVPPS